MLRFDEIDTVRAYRELCDLSGAAGRPFAFWIGAGGSAWCDYPLWGDLAELMHRDFTRHAPSYDSERGRALIDARHLPALFELSKQADSKRYFAILSDQFRSKSPTPVYSRFIATVSRIRPTIVLTTNVDEQLEKNLPTATTVQRTDIERAARLVDQGEDVIIKLHGSISAIESTVFSTSDYESLRASSDFLRSVSTLVGRLSLMFVGYGLGDEHFLSLLKQVDESAPLLGDGPHFAIVPERPTDLPESVRVIRYVPKPQTDHRASLSVIEEVAGRAATPTEIAKATPSSGAIISAHLVFDVHPPGTWETSQTLGITNEKGNLLQLVVGTGFSNAELPDARSTAMHDLIVGLTCFDKLYAPIRVLRQLHQLLGEERIRSLLAESGLEFVNWAFDEAIIYPSSEAVAGGDLGGIQAFNPDRSRVEVRHLISRQIQPLPGKEIEAQRYFDELAAGTLEIKREDEGDLPGLVRSLLLRPSIRAVIGMSEGTPVTSIPRWQVFPVLRLAHVVKMGAACTLLKAGSVKLNFGTSHLAGPAFAALSANDWADAAAGYVVAGRFSADLGVGAGPDVIDAVRRFRDTAAGASLRAEILSLLLTNEGADVAVAVNSGLSRGVPPAVLDRARDQFSRLYVPGANSGATAVWNDERYADNAVALWRQRSRQEFEAMCTRLGLGPYSACPCGSGDKVKWCCAEALAR